MSMNFIKKIVVNASRIPEKLPEIVELDFNPVIVNERTGRIVDARIILS